MGMMKTFSHGIPDRLFPAPVAGVLIDFPQVKGNRIHVFSQIIQLVFRHFRSPRFTAREGDIITERIMHRLHTLLLKH